MKIGFFNPSKLGKARKHGFMTRNLNRAGSKVLSRRRRKGRKRLIP